MAFHVDPNLYTTTPTRTPATTLSLFRALIAAAPKVPAEAVAKRMAIMHAKAKTLQTAWIDANRPDTTERVRKYDIKVDRCWGAIRARIQPWADVGDEDHGDRAAQVIELLFPTGLEFLTRAGPEQWSESDRRLALIDADQLEPDIIELAGKSFLDRLRQAHLEHGDVLGITKKKEPEVSPGVLQALSELRNEIAAYARLVLGLAIEPEEIEAAESQLEPILRFRKPKSAAEAEAEAEPVEAPLPDVPKGD